jgi:uncharacterized protein YjaZ
MNLEILPVFNHLDNYVAALKNRCADVQALWEKHAIAPYWPKLSKYAPFDISDRKPKPISDADALEQRIGLLRRLDLEDLKASFEKAAEALPDEDDTMYIGLYPLLSPFVRENQNGVQGASTWGNMIVNIDPLAEDYEQWIPYVFAHEYHHNIWGNYWFNVHCGELEPVFLNEILNDGLADSFALSLYPQHRPKWLFDMSADTEKRLWYEQYSRLLTQTGVDYAKYMFGDVKQGIPWCAGYAISFKIVQQYIKTHPGTSMQDLLEMRPMDIYADSGYPDF